MEEHKDIGKIINYCHKYAITDLKNGTAIPFGVVIDEKDKLLLVDNHKRFPEAERISHQNIVDMLTKHFGLQLFLETFTSYAITYYGKAQINNQGDQSDAFIINIVTSNNEELPFYVFPYSWSTSQEIIMGESYQMRKKSDQFYTSN